MIYSNMNTKANKLNMFYITNHLPSVSNESIINGIARKTSIYTTVDTVVELDRQWSRVRRPKQNYVD